MRQRRQTDSTYTHKQITMVRTYKAPLTLMTTQIKNILMFVDDDTKFVPSDIRSDGGDATSFCLSDADATMSHNRLVSLQVMLVMLLDLILGEHVTHMVHKRSKVMQGWSVTLVLKKTETESMIGRQYERGRNATVVVV